MSELVLWKEEGNVGFIEIHRPEHLNALNSDVLKSLKNILEQKVQLSSCAMIVLKSSGNKAFVAGADIPQMQNLSALEAQEFAALGHEVMLLLENLPQITLAQVQGWALGGGFELALSCDMIYASSKAQFGFPEVSLGIIPGFGGTQRLSRRVGYSLALDLISSCRKIKAQEAFDLGVIQKVVEPEKLEEEVSLWIQERSSHSPQAVRLAKKAVRRGLEGSLQTGLAIEASLFGLCFANQEAKEGLSAFLEKRKPLWNKK